MKSKYLSMMMELVRRAARPVAVALGGAALALGPADAARAVVPTANNGALVEFDAVGLGNANAGVPAFGNGFFVQNGQVLLGPGNGFDNLDANFGAGNFYTNTTHIGPVPVTTGAIVDPAGQGIAQTTVQTVGTFYGGGGLLFSAPTYSFDANNGNNTATVNVSSAFADFVNPASAPITLRTGSAVGISGFLPAGAYGALALTGYVIVPGTGETLPISPIVIALHDGGPQNGNDFALANGVRVGINQSTPSVGLFEAADPNVNGIDFQAYGVSLGSLITFPGLSRPAQARFTLTIISDPGAHFQIDSSALPPGTVLPDYGADALPEPSSLVLLSLGAAILGAAGLVRGRRSRGATPAA